MHTYILHVLSVRLTRVYTELHYVAEIDSNNTVLHNQIDTCKKRFEACSCTFVQLVV